MSKTPVPPRLLQIALDGAEARLVQAGAGPLSYRDCAVIANGVRPVLADLRAAVTVMRDEADTSGWRAEEAGDYLEAGWYYRDRNVYNRVLDLLAGSTP